MLYKQSWNCQETRWKSVDAESKAEKMKETNKTYAF